MGRDFSGSPWLCPAGLSPPPPHGLVLPASGLPWKPATFLVSGGDAGLPGIPQAGCERAIPPAAPCGFAVTPADLCSWGMERTGPPNSSPPCRSPSRMPLSYLPFISCLLNLNNPMPFHMSFFQASNRVCGSSLNPLWFCCILFDIGLPELSTVFPGFIWGILFQHYLLSHSLCIQTLCFLF